MCKHAGERERVRVRVRVRVCVCVRVRVGVGVGVGVGVRVRNYPGPTLNAVVRQELFDACQNIGLEAQASCLPRHYFRAFFRLGRSMSRSLVPGQQAQIRESSATATETPNV
jgi:hypothetical protein